MPSDLFYDAFFFFTRREAEKLRLVCRNFDALSSGLRDVHGYKLQIDWMSIGRKGTSESAKYSAIVEAYGRFHEIEGSDEEMAAGLKAVLSGSILQHGCIYTSALSESLCGEAAAFFSGVSVETVDLVGRAGSTYYNTVSSMKLQVRRCLSKPVMYQLSLTKSVFDYLHFSFAVGRAYSKIWIAEKGLRENERENPFMRVRAVFILYFREGLIEEIR